MQTRLNHGELNYISQIYSACLEIADRLDPKRLNKNDDANNLTAISQLAKKIIIKHQEEK